MSPLTAEDWPVSIVVVSLLGGEALGRCLRALGKVGRPVTVVGSGPAPGTQAESSVHMTYLRTDAPVSCKRHLGLSATRSEWVALLEDNCEISESWLAAVEEIVRRPDLAVVGGPVTIDTGLSPRSMALACMEYGEFARERVADHALDGARDRVQPTARVAGLNLLYRRAAIPPLTPAEGLIESEVNPAILERGGRIAVHPALRVKYCAEDRTGATLKSRYAFGRIYGGGQRARHSIPGRIVAVAKCAALPLVLLVRAARGLPRAYPWRLRAWGWMFAFAVAWSTGEGVGFALGRGASLGAWR